jgi:ParB/RepB/Spo0J family partition protein
LKIHPNARAAYRVTLQVLAFEVRSWNSLTELAMLTGRDKSNLQKSLVAMAEQGLITEGTFDAEITDDGRALLKALEDDADADIGPGPAQLPSGAPIVLHGQIVPDTLNPRKAFDDESLDELATSIRDQGLMQNLVVRAGILDADGQPSYRLISGERRWRAIARLIADGDWPADRPVPVQIRDIDDAEHATLALIENLQRKDLKPLEEAEALKGLMDQGNLTTADIAAKIGFTQRWVQQRLQLLKLSPEKRAALEDGKLTVEDARRWLANQPKLAELDDATWLMALEIFDYTERETTERPALINAVSDPGELQTLASLENAYWTRRQDQRVDHEKTGYVEITSRYLLEPALRLKFGDEITNEGERAAILASLQAAVIGEAKPAGTYFTSFLNAPYEIDPDILAGWQERKREIEAEQKEREEKDAQRAEALRVAQSKVQTVLDRHRRLPTGASTTEIATAAQALSHPLPWSVRGAGLYDANGCLLENEWGHTGELRLMLVAAAVNQAGGFVTPEPVADNDDDDLADLAEDIEDDEAEERLAADLDAGELEGAA